MTTLTIKTNALDNNIRIIKRLANGAKVIAVLKGNAYGLGLTKFASFLQSKGIDNYGVTELSDAVRCCHLTQKRHHGKYPVDDSFI